jgi:hypothetical protein
MTTNAATEVSLIRTVADAAAQHTLDGVSGRISGELGNAIAVVVVHENVILRPEIPMGANGKLQRNGPARTLASHRSLA